MKLESPTKPRSESIVDWDEGVWKLACLLEGTGFIKYKGPD